MEECGAQGYSGKVCRGQSPEGSPVQLRSAFDKSGRITGIVDTE